VLQPKVGSITADELGKQALAFHFSGYQGGEAYAPGLVESVPPQAREAAFLRATAIINKAHDYTVGLLQKAIVTLESRDIDSESMIRFLNHVPSMGQYQAVDPVLGHSRGITSVGFGALPSILRKILKYLEDTDIEFVAMINDFGKMATACAFAQPGVDKITLIPSFYEGNDLDDQATTIIHEVAHILWPSVKHSKDSEGWMYNAESYGDIAVSIAKYF
jgi:hypothetical protein